MVDCHKCQRFNACYDDDDECIGFVPKTMTNADRIRAMTDEELADTLVHKSDACWNCSTDSLDTCKECWLKWLKKEVDG